jgi:O-antigen/teichoic acid export membrane protein
VAALVASCVVAFATQGATTTALVIAAVALAKAIESLSDIFHGLFQRRETMDRIARSMVLRGASSLAAVIVGLHVWRHAAAAAALMACTSAVVLILFDVPNGAKLLGGLRRVSPRFDVRELLAMIRLALPLGVVTMLISLTTNIPRYFLEHAGGARGLGIFVGLAYVVTASAMVVGAVGRAATPRLANLHAAGSMTGFRSLVRSLVLASVAMAVLGVLVVLVFGRPILEVLYTPEYAAYAREFAIVMLAGGIGYAGSLLGYAVTACRHFAAQIPLWIGIVALTCLASAVLVPRFGVLGAAWALVVSAAAHLAGYAAFYVVRVVRARNG